MARKTKIVRIEDDGRDQGKLYFIKEMAASRAEKWATKVLMAMARSNLEVPKELMDAGWAGLALVGIKALGSMQFSEAEPLLDEMMACVKIIRDPRNPDMVFDLIETDDNSDIEEPATRVRLRMEIFALHAGPTFPVAGLMSAAGTTSAGSPNTGTSPAP